MKTNRKVKALNPKTNKIEDGVIVGESTYFKTYDIRFDSGIYTINKQGVQLI
jgi:hypothetical protein